MKTEICTDFAIVWILFLLLFCVAMKKKKTDFGWNYVMPMCFLLFRFVFQISMFSSALPNSNYSESTLTVTVYKANAYTHIHMSGSRMYGKRQTNQWVGVNKINNRTREKRRAVCLLQRKRIEVEKVHVHKLHILLSDRRCIHTLHIHSCCWMKPRRVCRGQTQDSIISKLANEFFSVVAKQRDFESFLIL